MMTNKLKHIVRDGVDYSKTHMEGQIKANRYLVFEPPWNAWSWKQLVIVEVSIGSGDNSICDGEAVGGCDVDDCGTVGGCVTEGRAVDELCSTFGIKGASVGSGDMAAGVSACD